MMNEYLEAERLGRADQRSCSSAYSTCTFSLFENNKLRGYSTPDDKPKKQESLDKDKRPVMKKVNLSHVDDPHPRIDYDEINASMF